MYKFQTWALVNILHYDPNSYLYLLQLLLLFAIVAVESCAAMRPQLNTSLSTKHRFLLPVTKILEFWISVNEVNISDLKDVP